MDITNFNRSTKLNRTEMEGIATYLIQELSDFLEQDVSCFKRHIVDSESCVCMIQGPLVSDRVFDLCFEGVVLFQIRNTAPPSVNAELFLFSSNNRVGLQTQDGRSFLVLDFDFEASPPNWKVQGWRNDGPDDWERIDKPRTELYGTLKDTWDDNE